MIVFRPLTREDLTQIIDIELDKLYERITDLGYKLVLTDQAKAYDDLFKYWTDENTPDEEDPPFPEKMLNNWFIEDEDGEKKEIGLPGVFDRNNRKEILWRYF